MKMSYLNDVVEINPTNIKTRLVEKTAAVIANFLLNHGATTNNLIIDVCQHDKKWHLFYAINGNWLQEDAANRLKMKSWTADDISALQQKIREKL